MGISGGDNNYVVFNRCSNCLPVKPQDGFARRKLVFVLKAIPRIAVTGDELSYLVGPDKA